MLTSLFDNNISNELIVDTVEILILYSLLESNIECKFQPRNEIIENYLWC